ncbi:pyruvate kinase 1, cytosolic-like [Papaver somniferum]|uniref:pyruvate kinase 1, cytosolic-like n=1 Tax=Papaver somniferum TaxID=3469 RepID=UPI000E6FBB54|nr:pyruvate kinase 1, cytosolic-like [Papaver somniferum]
MANAVLDGVDSILPGAETLRGLYPTETISTVRRICAEVMLDTVGPELQVVNKSEKTIALEAESLVLSTPDQDKEATSDLLPISYVGLAK